MAVQKTAAELALGLSLPHRKMEDWRWTDLRQLVDKPYPPRQTVAAAAKDVERLLKVVALCQGRRRPHGFRQWPLCRSNSRNSRMTL